MGLVGCLAEVDDAAGKECEAWCLLTASVRSLISYHVSEGLDTLQLHFQPTGAGLEIAEGVFCRK